MWSALKLRLPSVYLERLLLDDSLAAPNAASDLRSLIYPHRRLTLAATKSLFPQPAEQLSSICRRNLARQCQGAKLTQTLSRCSGHFAANEMLYAQCPRPVKGIS